MLQEKKLNLVSAIDGTKIINLQKAIGEINVLKAITYFLLRFSESFNVGKNITDSQASIIALDILEKYPYETFEDVVLMLKQVRQGIIGDGKDYKVDGQNVFVKWFPQYLDQKYIEVERQNKIKTDELAKEQNSEDNAVSQYYAKLRAEKKRKETEALAKKHIDEMVKPMNRQQLEGIISEWSLKPEMKPYLDYLKRKRLSKPS